MSGGGQDPWAAANNAHIANASSGNRPSNPKNIYGVAAAAAQYAALQVLTATSGAQHDAPAGGSQSQFGGPPSNFARQGMPPPEMNFPPTGARSQSRMKGPKNMGHNSRRGKSKAQRRAGLLDHPPHPGPNQFNGPPGPNQFNGPPGPNQFHGPPGPNQFNRPPGPNQFNRPPGPNQFNRPPGPNQFNRPPRLDNFGGPFGPNNFERPSNLMKFEGPQAQFNGPPGPFNGPSGSFDGPPGPFQRPPGTFQGPPGPFSGPTGLFDGPPRPNNGNMPSGPNNIGPQGPIGPNAPFHPDGNHPPGLMGFVPPNEMMRPKGRNSAKNIKRVGNAKFGKKLKLNATNQKQTGRTRGKAKKRTATAASQGPAANKKPRQGKSALQDSGTATRHVDGDMKVTISGAAANKGSLHNLQYFCTACQVTIKLASDFQQHLRGIKHRDSVEKNSAATDEASDKGVPSGQYLTEKDVKWDPSATLIPAADAKKSKFYCSMCRVALLSEENVKYHMARASHITCSETIESLEKNKGNSEEVCIPCQELITAETKDEHLSNKGHLSNIHWRLAPCELCDVQFNTVDALYKHFYSEKHRAAKVGIKSTIITPVAMVKYFESLSAVAEERKRSACELCTLFFVADENKELHDLYNEVKHRKKRAMGEAVQPGQFYCYPCDKALPLNIRASHVKTNEHNNKKTARQSWNCEHCGEKFNNENGLVIHMGTKKHEAVASKRKKLMNYAVEKARRKWQSDLLEAAGQISEHMEDMANNGSLPKGNTADVIQVAGSYCSVCKKFFMSNTPGTELCPHVPGYQLPEGNTTDATSSETAVTVEPAATSAAVIDTTVDDSTVTGATVTDAADADAAVNDAADADAADADAADADAADTDAADTDAAGTDAAGTDAADTDAAGTDGATNLTATNSDSTPTDSNVTESAVIESAVVDSAIADSAVTDSAANDGDVGSSTTIIDPASTEQTPASTSV